MEKVKDRHWTVLLSPKVVGLCDLTPMLCDHFRLPTDLINISWQHVWS